jgi:hypothetical protein
MLLLPVSTYFDFFFRNLHQCCTKGLTAIPPRPHTTDGPKTGYYYYFDFFLWNSFQGGTMGLSAVPPRPHTPDGLKTGYYYYPITTMSCQAGRSRALRVPNLLANTWPITKEALWRPWILLKHDHYQSPQCHVKVDGAARSDGPNLHANTWPITTELLSRPWILLKHDHYQSPLCHVKLDWAARSDCPNLHANTWPLASTVQPSFLWEHRCICGPSLTETALYGAYKCILYVKRNFRFT